MRLSPWAIYALAMAAVPVVGRTWARFKMDRRARRAYASPLFDSFALEVALAPREGDGDDGNILAEIKQTMAHLNRQSYAEEFWSLHKQLAEYYNHIPIASRPTMRRALVRMIASNDRWIQIAGAKTCAALSLPEAVPALEALLASPAADSQEDDPLAPYLPPKPDQSAAELRFHAEIEAALAALSPNPLARSEKGSQAAK